MSGRRSDIREAVRGGLAVGLMFGVGAFLVLLTFMGLDYRSTRDVPTEQATVISMERVETKVSCGRSFTAETPGVRTVFRSDAPPVGLPAEFAVVQCPGATQDVGDRVPVRRTGTAEDDITLEPIESVTDWLLMATVGGIACTIIAAAICLTRELWSVRRSRLRRARRRQSTPEPSA